MAHAVALIRRSQNLIGGTSRSVISAIVESGLDLSKISFADLNRLMTDADRRPRQNIGESELTQEINRSMIRPENARNIITSLYNHGLNYSDKNINALENAYERIPETVGPGAVEEIISKESELTLDNVYKSCFAGEKKTETPELPPREVLEDFFNRMGIEITRENIRTAMYLLRRDLPLTRENIEKIQFLQSFNRDAVSETLFFDKAAEHLAAGKPIGSMHITEITRNAEIMLKLATEAANRRQDLINIDAMREHVRNLQLSELEAIRFLKLAGAEAEPEQATRLTNLFDAVRAIKPLTSNVHVDIMQGRVDFTITGIRESVLYAKAAAGYEQNATVPDPRYGDSFSRVKGQFAPLLEGMGITATNENLKAAFILSKNNIDVTEENLSQVKITDAKINAVVDRLHPMIAANMIKEGLNPLNMHADQMLAYIKQWNLQAGEDKISKYIMEMDESGAIDPETRKAMIAIYRMLNVIRRDGAAALGLAMQMEGLKSTPMTLGELLNLAQRPRTDITDASGRLESLTRPPESIRGILQSITPIPYSEIITENFAAKAAPENLQSMLQSSLNEAFEDLANLPSDPAKPEPSQMIEQIETFVSANPEIIRQLMGRGINTTPGNIRAFERLSNSRRALEDEIEELAENEPEILDSLPDTGPEELRRSPSQILARILSVVDGNNKSDISNLLAITHALNGDGERGFQIPIKLGGKVAKLSLYVINERALSSDGAKILMSLDTSRLGVINAYFTVLGNSVDIDILTESNSAAEALAGESGFLSAVLAESGFTITGFTFRTGAESLPEASTAPAPQIPRAETAYDFRV